MRLEYLESHHRQIGWENNKGTNVVGGSIEVQLRDHDFHLSYQGCVSAERPGTGRVEKKGTHENHLAPWHASQALMSE